MSLAPLIVCKGFLDRSPPEVRDRLFNLLPRQEQLTFNEFAPSAPFNHEDIKIDPIEGIHFSWLTPYLRTLTETDIRFFLASLSKKQIKGLEKALGLPDHLPPIPLVAHHFLRQVIFDHLSQNQELIPQAFLPVAPLNDLLKLDTTQLETLVVYLGLHDLSFEMKQIISTAILKKIFGALSEAEGEFLNSLLLNREPLVYERLFLQKWDGTKEHLRKLLVERGLNRLGHALHDANESLIWYITHRLDHHQGATLLKYKEKPTQPREEKLLLDQINKILTNLSHKERI